MRAQPTTYRMENSHPLLLRNQQEKVLLPKRFLRYRFEQETMLISLRPLLLQLGVFVHFCFGGFVLGFVVVIAVVVLFQFVLFCFVFG